MYFFEGAEKKAEIIVNSDVITSLLEVPESFWVKLLEQCDAKIISSIENEQCKAYLLSESSLFVWHSRFLLVTCGTCQLVKSVEYFIKFYGEAAIEHVSYQRKNEYFSHAQPSCFGDDAQLLNHYIDGKAFCFGEMDSHHNYLYHQSNGYKFSSDYKSYQFVAYQIGHLASQLLTTPNLSKNNIREFFQLETVLLDLLADFKFDDHCFTPFGYSFNAIHKDKYLTVHVTPQANSSYISIESNICLLTLIPHFLAILSPKSFDLFTRNESNFTALTNKFIPEKFISQTRVFEQLDNNVDMNFAHYIVPSTEMTSATVIDIEKTA